MRQSSNPIFRSLTKVGAQGGAQAGVYQYGQANAPYPNYQAPTTTRSLSVDDVVAKTGTSLAVVTVTAVISYFLTVSNPSLGLAIAMICGLVGFGLVLYATFGRQQDNPAVVLSYSAVEGFFLGAITHALTMNVMGVSAGVLIAEAAVGTLGVFAGMLAVYKTGAVRVTPRTLRVFVGMLLGVVALSVVNLLASFFVPGGLGLRGNGTVAIIFSLVCIALAAFSFLVDFDQADQLIRAGAPQKAAWGVALGLTITVVWLYTEILRLVVSLNSSD